MKLSVITTLYQSQEYIKDFYNKICTIGTKFANSDFEIIFVNDGSPDNSLDIIAKLANNDSRIVIIDLSRNFGHHKAIMTGLQYANGEYVFLIDSDLEENPDWFFKLYNLMQETKSDVTYGVQTSRKGNFFEKLTGYIYFKLFSLLSNVNQPHNILTIRLMTKRYVTALLTYKEQVVNIGYIWSINGFKQTPLKVNKLSTSPTSYSIRKKISHFVNGITSASSFPLVFTFYSGIILSIFSIFFIIYLICRYFFFSSPPSGYTSIIASICFFSGLIIFFMGLQSIYLSIIFTEVKKRPYTTIRKIIRTNAKRRE